MSDAGLPLTNSDRARRARVVLNVHRSLFGMPPMPDRVDEAEWEDNLTSLVEDIILLAQRIVSPGWNYASIPEGAEFDHIIERATENLTHAEPVGDWPELAEEDARTTVRRLREAGMELGVIAERLGITRERVRQLVHDESP